MICVACGNVEGGRKGHTKPCSRCGEALRRESNDNVKLAAEALALARIRELVAQWSNEGVIDRTSHDRILERLSHEEGPSADEQRAEEQARAEAAFAERSARARAEYEANEVRVRAEQRVQSAMIQAELARQAALLRAEADAHEQPKQAREETPHEELPQGEGMLGAGLGALVALDADKPPSIRQPGKWETEVRPLLYENVGWFIGTLLVLAGSIYGVREAWRTLGGVARHVTVGGALFAYHALFVGLSALLAKKSVTTGKVLATIALGLLPVVFVALSSTLQVSVPSGVMIGLLFGALSIFTVSSIGRRLEVASPLAYALAFVPSLLAELPLAITEPDAWGRVAVPLVGVGALAFVIRFAGLATQLSVGYGAIALGIYALVGGPDDAARGPLAAAGFGLWAAALAGTVILASEREDTRTEHPRASAVAGVAALGVILIAAFRASAAVFASRGTAREVALAHALTALVSVGAFGWIGRRRNAGLHFATLSAGVAGFLLARVVSPELPETWLLGTAISVGLGFVGARFLDDRRRRPIVGWGVVLALLAMFVAPILEKGTLRWTFVTLLVIAASAHLGASVHRRGLHYLGGFAAVLAAMAWFLPNGVDGTVLAERILLASGAAFAAAAFAFDALNSDPDQKRARPFDDLSSAALLFAVAPAASRITMPARLLLDPRALAAAVSLRPTIAIVGVALVARSLRDRTAWGSFLGALTIGALLLALTGIGTAGETAWVLAVIALGLALLANARGTATDADEKIVQRHLFGTIPLPFPARGARAIGDGFARASWVATVASVLAMFGWLAQRVEVDRPRVVMAGVLLVLTQLVGFFTPAFAGWGLRGSVAALSLGTVFVGLTAVVNRIGRPLPLPVVGWKLSLVAIGVWLFAQLARKKGPALGRRLGDEESGERYHVVFHTCVALLAALLVVDALINSGGSVAQALSAIPPTMLLGSAVALALLASSLASPWLLHVAAPLAIGGAALIATQRNLLGSAPPVLLSAPVAFGRALLGPAVCGVVLAGSAAVVQRRSKEENALPLAVWTVIVAGVIVASGWFRAEVLPAALVTLSGIVLLVDRPKLGRAVAATGAMLIVHAAAQAAPQIPLWAGPAIAVFAIVALIGRRADSTPALPPSESVADEEPLLDGFAGLALGIAFAYAFAQGGTPDPTAAGPSVVNAALDALTGGWVLRDAPGATAALAGIGLVVSGMRSQNRGRAYLGHVLGALVLVLAATSGTFFVDRVMNPSQWRSAVLAMPPIDLPTWLLRRLGPSLACAFAVLALVQHAIAVVTKGLAKDDGAPRVGRDLLLLATAIAGIAFVLSGLRPLPYGPSQSALATGFGAIVIASATAAHAAFRERSSRHVYFVQLSIVASYGLFRSEFARNLPPEADATFALLLGFLLLGVTVQARRAKIPEIAASTRTFAALLPVAVALWMPRQASMSAAMVAAASGALYGALAWLEKSRLFGSLGAAAVNLALLLVARSQGLNGREIDLAALGLLILALGHVFTDAMEHGARVSLRVVGGLFLYAPAAYRLATELGNGPNGAYSVGFGAACLLGILVGMVLHIRAYLAFGTLFLVLDVIANLTAAGLRDHRIGFLVLSLAGLSVLGVMVLVTLQRERVHALATRLRLSLRGWD